MTGWIGNLFYGSANYLTEKYGFTTGVLPVILGDYVNDSKVDTTKIKCNKGNFSIDGLVKDVRIRYLMDCNLAKSTMTMPYENINGSGLQIKYDDFFNVDKINVPGRIEISDKQRNTTLEIRIQKITIPWEGTIDFIPGRAIRKNSSVMRFLLGIVFLFFWMNHVLYGQSKAELEDKRKKTLEEINYVDNLLKTTAKEKSEGMNAVKIIGQKAGPARNSNKGDERGN